MLLNYFRGIFRKRVKERRNNRFDLQTELDIAAGLVNAGNQHSAIKKYREILEHDPSNLVALNDLSSCLSNIGDNEEAQRLFDLALALDDTFLPVLTNRAKLLVDQRKSAPARALLARAKVTNPFFAAVDGVYQAVLFQHGETDLAVTYMRKTWLACFDQLRMANGYLFSASYKDIDERQMAQEHRFWADSLAPLPETPHDPELHSVTTLSDGRIRIGYLSPDFRDHSVRFFFRPLLENHDVTRFEVFLFHDAHLRDEQTTLIQARAEHFHDVAQMTDAELIVFLQKHQLDILVDLAGHTSYNRMNIFSGRLARIQINAIGYPPTTGLSSMDYKLMDRHVWTEDFAHYYTEKPLVLPGSFWCYDPMIDVPVPVAPPCTMGKPLVFGCIGNVAKVTDRILACWVQILQRVPESRLLVRSVSFQDDAVFDTLRKRFEVTGFDMARVDLRRPEGGEAYYTSYNDIDIVLDTYPFNGGTTTSFAVYMGVPVITWAGKSLVSRMGRSIMRNMGMPECVATDAAGYVEAAVSLAFNQASLVSFRADARQRMRNSPLGNGRIFTQEFEAACVTTLQNTPAESGDSTQVAVLPARELVQRAYAVLLRDQTEAALRILTYASVHYPYSASVCILQTQLACDAGNVPQAISDLHDKLTAFTSEEQSSVRIFLAHHYIKTRSRDAARQVLTPVFDSKLSDEFDQVQLHLYAALLRPVPLRPQWGSIPDLSKILVLCIGDDAALQRTTLEMLRALSLPDGWALEMQSVPVSHRVAAYKSATNCTDVDVVIVMHNNVKISNPLALVEVAKGLQHADVLGFAGAKRWQRFDWRADAFSQKTATYMVSDAAHGGALELRWVGGGFEELQSDLAVLDGALLAFRPERMRGVEIDTELLSAGVLLEEAWVHAAHRQERRLAALRTLDVVLDERSDLDHSNQTEAYLHLIAKWDMAVFSPIADDLMYATLSLESIEEGHAVCQRLCTSV